jgi:hypothetical protein
MEYGNGTGHLKVAGFQFPAPLVMDVISWSSSSDEKFSTTNPRTNPLFMSLTATTTTDFPQDMEIRTRTSRSEQKHEYFRVVK